MGRYVIFHFFECGQLIPAVPRGKGVSCVSRVSIVREYRCAAAVAFVLSGLALVAVEANNLRRTVRPAAGAAPQAPTPPPAAQPATAPAATADDHALIQKYCATCHNERVKTGGVVPSGSQPRADSRHSRETWEKVVRKLRGGMMPPQGMPRPDEADARRARGVASRQRSIARRWRRPIPAARRSIASTAPNTATPSAICWTWRSTSPQLLPADDESNGFDNIADVLQVSPSLLEQYLAAARKISSLAVGDPTTTSSARSYRVPPDDSQEDHIEGLPLGTRGGLLVPAQLPARRRVRLQRQAAAEHRRLHDRARVRRISSRSRVDGERAVPGAGRRRGRQPRVGREHVARPRT